MKKIYLLLFFSIFSFLFINLSFAQCSNGRYRDPIFSYTSDLEIQFGSAIDYTGAPQNLFMDVYQPKGDIFAKRPLMILAFGGSFTSGFRESPDMVQLCQEFAKRGFVTVTIDYRIGEANGADSCAYQAVLRGIQDMNAAIRYFYKDASTINTYRVDTTQIFVGGTSAGAFIGLNKAYAKLTQFSRPVDPVFTQAFVSVGGTEGTSGNPGYSDNVKGVVDLCGAIMDTIWIQPGDPMLVGVHGTGDSTVPYYYDSIEGAQDIKKRFFGGGNIIDRCTHIGFMPFFIRTFPGAPHAPFVLPYPLIPPASLYMDTTIQVLEDFFYQNVICDSVATGINEVGGDITVNVFPNPADEPITVLSHDSRDLIIAINTLDGKLVEQRLLTAYGSQTIRKEDLSSGMYLLNFYDDKGINRLKTEKIVFY